MTALVLAMMLSAAQADSPCATCPPVQKVWKGNIKCKPPLQKYRCGDRWRCLKAPPGATPVVESVVPATPPAVPEPPAPVPELAPEPAVELPPPPSPWKISAVGQVGPTLCGPEGTLLLGARVRHEPAHLGAQFYTLFARGTGLKALLYPVQEGSFRLHLDAGVLYQPSGHPSVSAVPRRWDWTVGAGADIPVSKRFALLVDWMWSRPFSTPGGYGATSVTEDSLRGSTALVGVEVILP